MVLASPIPWVPPFDRFVGVIICELRETSRTGFSADVRCPKQNLVPHYAPRKQEMGVTGSYGRRLGAMGHGEEWFSPGHQWGCSSQITNGCHWVTQEYPHMEEMGPSTTQARCVSVVRKLLTNKQLVSLGQCNNANKCLTGSPGECLPPFIRTMLCPITTLIPGDNN